MSRKRITLFAAFLLTVIGGTWLLLQQRTTSPTSNRLSVVASYYPLYDFARQVGGDKVSITTITPAGAEPHDYEPTPKVLADAEHAAVFIYNGGQMEPWVAGFLSDYKHSAVKASAGIVLQSTTGEGTAAQVQDPHFWLDPVLAQQIIKNIQQGLTQADPADAAYFAQNAESYIAKLSQLDKDFRATLASCQTRTLVTSHDAFGYLARRYNLTVYAIAGLTPDEEPSAGKLAELARLVRDQHIRYIFFERLVSPRLADTIAAETGAQTLVFDPIEGVSNAAQTQGKNYLTIQQDNLASLRTALACR